MKQLIQQKLSLRRLFLTLTLGSGLVANILHFMSMGHYPKTNDEQVAETVALWFGMAFIVLTICYVLAAILYRRN